MAKTALAAQPANENPNTGLNQKSRSKLAEDLGKVLGDTYTLLVKTHVYHWNVVGPVFLSLHELTEDHYKNLFQAADDIAERIRALGYTTPLSFEKLESMTQLHEETSKRSAQEMVKHLIADHEEMARRIRSITAAAAEDEDFVTHDLLNARLAFHEKAIWMLGAIVA